MNILPEKKKKIVRFFFENIGSFQIVYKIFYNKLFLSLCRTKNDEVKPTIYESLVYTLPSE